MVVEVRLPEADSYFNAHGLYLPARRPFSVVLKIGLDFRGTASEAPFTSALQLTPC